MTISEGKTKCQYMTIKRSNRYSCKEIRKDVEIFSVGKEGEEE